MNSADVKASYAHASIVGADRVVFNIICARELESVGNRQDLPLLEELPKLHSRARSLPQRFIHP
jgi:hypothetical protein